MIDPVSPLAGWDNFYVVVGSSAGALTGLQFVVIALIAEIRSRGSTGHEIAAFGTPTVVHFCVALLVSAALSAPWTRLYAPAAIVGLTGLAGLLYAAIVIRRARSTTSYKPVFEDWLWHAILPVIAYGLLVAAGVGLVDDVPHPALYAIAAASLLLVFIGIHNAWDTVTYITLNREQLEGGAPAGPPAPVRQPTPASREHGSGSRKRGRRR